LEFKILARLTKNLKSCLSWINSKFSESEFSELMKNQNF
jgi:hypothetical protein